MKKINTIIIDDEEGALNTLRGMLSKFCPNVHIVAEATTPADAVTKIKRHKPDLLLLDIEMPPFGTSFDIIKQVPDHEFGVIFITAYPQYAIDAINVVQPWAYLVKPFSIVRLQTALNIAEQKIENQSAHILPQGASDTLLIETTKSTLVLNMSDIILCQSDEAMVYIFISRQGETEMIRTPRALKDLEQELPKHLFFRTHHSFIINLLHIDRWERTGRNGLINMKNDMRVPISVQKMPLFEAHMIEYLNLERR